MTATRPGAWLPALLLTACPLVAGAGEPMGSHIEAAELLRLIEAGSAPTIVDVRTRSEFESGHVPGALHMPFWAVFARASDLSEPADQPIVVYCEHGPRAGLAKAALRAVGFREVLYLEGHMSDWKRAGLPQEITAPPP